mmetsp:Transcript_43466/g.52700  ORF Transcript_43466/g.52700 Transcript_43466/m.52700 type:complete len:85 (+) Transcript_43466:926-1180(+)
MPTPTKLSPLERKFYMNGLPPPTLAPLMSSIVPQKIHITSFNINTPTLTTPHIISSHMTTSMGRLSFLTSIPSHGSDTHPITNA